MLRSKKLSLAGILIALGVVSSGFFIPIGAAKVFPMQHMINILAATILGPFYGIIMAFCTSLIRLFAGTGTLLAFPGSMVGALIAGLLYKKFNHIVAAFLGEIIGTGIIGAILSYPIARFIMSRDAAIFGFVIPFFISSFSGALIGIVLVFTLNKIGIVPKEHAFINSK